MYYVLLTLTEETFGSQIMRRVKVLSDGRVTIGPGTLYAMLSKFVENGLVKSTSTVAGMKNYIITDKGKEVLKAEYERLKQLISDGSRIVEMMRW